MSLLLDAWRIIKAVPEAAGVALEAGKAGWRVIKSFRRMPKPRVPPREESTPLPYTHVRHIDEMSKRGASHGLVVGGESTVAPQNRPWAHLDNPASPRAVTERPRTIIPPKR